MVQLGGVSDRDARLEAARRINEFQRYFIEIIEQKRANPTEDVISDLVHATLADRDRIASDDYVQILLSTFDDGRQASVFAVNPFGVQSDGALVETGSTSGNGFNNAVVRRERADLSPDFVFQSKGRVTGYGYEVEILER